MICDVCSLVLDMNLSYNLPQKILKDAVSSYDDLHVIDCCYRMQISSDQIIESIQKNLHDAKRRNCFSGSKKKCLAAFIIYNTLKLMHIPKSIEQVAYACGVSTNDIWKCEASDDSVPVVIDIKDILPSIHSEVGLSFKECNMLCNIRQIFKNRSFSPYTMTGALIYIFCKEKKRKMTLKKIANVLKVSNVSIHRCIKYLKGNKNLYNIITSIC